MIERLVSLGRKKIIRINGSIRYHHRFILLQKYCSNDADSAKRFCFDDAIFRIITIENIEAGIEMIEI